MTTTTTTTTKTTTTTSAAYCSNGQEKPYCSFEIKVGPKPSSLPLCSASVLQQATNGICCCCGKQARQEKQHCFHTSVAGVSMFFELQCLLRVVQRHTDAQIPIVIVIVVVVVVIVVIVVIVIVVIVIVVIVIVVIVVIVIA